MDRQQQLARQVKVKSDAMLQVGVFVPKASIDSIVSFYSFDFIFISRLEEEVIVLHNILFIGGEILRFRSISKL